MLPHEKLWVYGVAKELRAVLGEVVPRRAPADLRGQINRASSSVLLNIAEGAGRSARAAKAHFYEIALGSATETCACLDTLRIDRLIGDREYGRAYALAGRIIAALTKLAAPPRAA